MQEIYLSWMVIVDIRCLLNLFLKQTIFTLSLRSMSSLFQLDGPTYEKALQPQLLFTREISRSCSHPSRLLLCITIFLLMKYFLMAFPVLSEYFHGIPLPNACHACHIINHSLTHHAFQQCVLNHCNIV